MTRLVNECLWCTRSLLQFFFQPSSHVKTSTVLTQKSRYNLFSSRMTPITNLKTLIGGIGHAKLVSRHMKFGWLILISSFP